MELGVIYNSYLMELGVKFVFFIIACWASAHQTHWAIMKWVTTKNTQLSTTPLISTSAWKLCKVRNIMCKA